MLLGKPIVRERTVKAGPRLDLMQGAGVTWMAEQLGDGAGQRRLWSTPGRAPCGGILALTRVQHVVVQKSPHEHVHLTVLCASPSHLEDKQSDLEDLVCPCPTGWK